MGPVCSAALHMCEIQSCMVVRFTCPYKIVQILTIYGFLRNFIFHFLSRKKKNLENYFSSYSYHLHIFLTFAPADIKISPARNFKINLIKSLNSFVYLSKFPGLKSHSDVEICIFAELILYFHVFYALCFAVDFSNVLAYWHSSVWI